MPSRTRTRILFHTHTSPTNRSLTISELRFAPPPGQDSPEPVVARGTGKARAPREHTGPGIRSHFHAVRLSALAVVTVGLFFGSHTLAANADETDAMALAVVQPKADPAIQSLEVGTAEVAPPVRADYSITAPPPPPPPPTPVVKPRAGVQWPLGRDVRISSWFGYRPAPCATCSTDHKGLDMNPGAGTPIKIIADGVVSEVGNPSGEYGVYAIIDHVINGQRITSVYAHMQLGSLTVRVGDTVSAGEVVGLVGSTGESTGAHLHFEIRRDGVRIDPYAWLQANAG
jgi:murein DD-endopeptidase MepM/ murein hydrolase activator NlpD